MSEAILQVKRLTVSFRTSNGKVHAVRDISFDLEKGETLAIVGESGSGKSVTSKAILGISAGNAIHENGEILYGDKDLLQIDEEDFHKIRGDKIAMVFQDPLSALNPIMRTGKQLTEAMILNNKAERRDASKNIKILRKSLYKYAHIANKDKESANIDKEFAGFRKIQDEQIKIEISFDSARENLREARRLSNALRLDLDKHVHSHVNAWSTKLYKVIKGGVNEFVLSNEQANEYVEKIQSAINQKGYKEAIGHLENFLKLADKKLEEKIPDFFLVAFSKAYPDSPKYSSKEECFEDASIAPFIDLLEKTLLYADEHFAKKRSEALEMLKSKRSIVAEGKLDIAATKKAIQLMSAKVEEAINPLDVIKDSQMYTFKKGMENVLRQYKEALSKNKKEQKRYNKDKAKYDKESKGGKKPEWKLVALDLTDVSHIRGIMLEMLDRMINKLSEKQVFEDTRIRAKAVIVHASRLASRAVFKVTNAMARDRAIALMREVGIPEPEIRFNQYPFELSGGMRQRIVIAIALSANPDILICDEPTTALDVTIQAQILELINRIKKERGLSIIFITHDLGVVANMADRIAVMYAGKIVEIGNAEDVFYDPKHPYTWALLSSMPDLETKEKLSAIPGTPPNMLFPPVGDAFAARNQYAMKIDFEMQPPMFKVSDTHYAATWLLHPDAPQVEPPAIVTERIQRMRAWEAKQNGEQ